MSQYAELKAQIAKLQAQADEARRAELATVIADIRQKIAEFGLSATDLGFPSGAKYQPVTGEWERQYTRGYVIVNPTKSTVTVGGDTIPSGDAILHQNKLARTRRTSD